MGYGKTSHVTADFNFQFPISSAVALPHNGVGQYVVGGQGHPDPRNADSHPCNKPAQEAGDWHGKYTGHGRPVLIAISTMHYKSR